MTTPGPRPAVVAVLPTHLLVVKVWLNIYSPRPAVATILPPPLRFVEYDYTPGFRLAW